MRRLFAILVGFLLLASGRLQAQGGFDPERDVGLAFRKGAVVLTVPQGAHLKAAFMEVTLKKGTPGTLKAGPLPPTRDKDELGDGVWHDRVVIPVAGEGLKGDVELVVEYQPCTEGPGGVCYPPTDRILKVPARAIPPLATPDATPAKPQAPAAAPAKASPTPAPVAAGPMPPQPASPQPAPPAPVSSSSLLWSFLVIFLFGMGASFTPCVFPMIPITMAIIGAKGGGKGRGFALSVALVLGMAVTYTTLGVLAARAGASAGAWAQRPAFLIPISLIFALFALSLFGAFEIKLPDALQQKLQGGGPRKGYGGAFFMGLILGPISAPCVGPIVGAVLLAIAQKGNVLLGAAQLFTFALGMGILFLAVGTFSASLPRSGDWLVRLKQMMGVVILAFAVWSVRLIIPSWLYLGLWGATLITASATLEAFRPAEDFGGSVRKGFGLLALAAGLALGCWGVAGLLWTPLLRGAGMGAGPAFTAGGEAAAAAPGREASPWLQQDLEEALARARAGNRLVLVDTYAEWCAQCKELDEKTWSDPQVAAWIKEKAVPVRIDTDKVRKDLAPRLGIIGYPTVLVLDADGKELRRSMGFLPPAEMVKFLQK